ncbi:MAG: hypothetical protein CMJ78_26200 [Planctomycetaceae bacterium]|nr:hypothetical protein [Planctomycetaceae bacterium]
MDTSATNSRESISDALRPQIDWHSLSQGQQIQSLESDGYVVLPELLSAEEIESIAAELAVLPTRAVDYSEHQRGFSGVQWTDSPSSIAVVALQPTVDFLNRLFGDDLICTAVDYAVSGPGHPGIAIHTDAQPYGSQIFGLQSSCPCLVRVLYYLDELTPERSPFKVIPRSHLSMHADGNPYRRYLSHPDELMVTCAAGSAVLINQKVFHGNFPNYSDEPRRMLAIAYRPLWAGPIGEVDEHDADKLAKLPAEIRQYFASPNERHIEYDLPNRPDNMSRDAAGISPSRWQE